MWEGLTIVKGIVGKKEERERRSEVGSASSTGGRHYYGLVFRPHAQHPHTQTACEACVGRLTNWPGNDQSCKRVIRHAKSFPGIELPGIGWKEAARCTANGAVDRSLSRSVAARSPRTIARQKRCWIFEHVETGMRTVYGLGRYGRGCLEGVCRCTTMACCCGRVGGKCVLFSPRGRCFSKLRFDTVYRIKVKVT